MDAALLLPRVVRLGARMVSRRLVGERERQAKEGGRKRVLQHRNELRVRTVSGQACGSNPTRLILPAGDARRYAVSGNEKAAARHCRHASGCCRLAWLEKQIGCRHQAELFVHTITQRLASSHRRSFYVATVASNSISR